MCIPPLTSTATDRDRITQSTTFALDLPPARTQLATPSIEHLSMYKQASCLSTRQSTASFDLPRLLIANFLASIAASALRASLCKRSECGEHRESAVSIVRAQ